MVEHPQVPQEGHQLAQRQVLAEDPLSADEPHQDAAELEQHADDGVEDRHRVLHAAEAVANVRGRAAETLILPLLLAERLHHANAREDRVQNAVQLAVGVPDAEVPGVDTLPEEHRREDHEGRRQQRDQRQLPVEAEQDGPDGRHRDQLGHEPPGQLVDEPLHLLRVADDATHELADVVAVVVGHAQLRQVVEHSRPHVIGDLRADEAGHPARQDLCDRDEQVSAQQGPDQRQQPPRRHDGKKLGVARLLGGEHLVDQQADKLLGNETQADGDQDQRDHQDGLAGVRAHQLQHAQEDGPPLDAAPADVSLEFQGHAAPGALAGVVIVIGPDLGLLAGTPGLQLHRDLLEEVRLGIRVRQELHVDAPGQGLQEPAADSLASPDLSDVFAAQAGSHGRPSPGGHAERQEAVGLGEKEHPLVPAFEIQVRARCEPCDVGTHCLRDGQFGQLRGKLHVQQCRSIGGHPAMIPVGGARSAAGS